MNRILFIVPYPVGEAPSQRFRYEQYFDVLKQRGYEVKVASFWTISGWKSLYSSGKAFTKGCYLFLGFVRRMVLMFQIPRYNMVFIHREVVPIGPPIFEFLIAKVLRKRIIYDFDDAIWLANTSDQNSIAGKLKFHGKVKAICSWSSKVSCGNQFLADFARKYNDIVFVNPTTIDTSYHVPAQEKNESHPVIIGWTGSHSTLKYIELILPVLIELKKKESFRLLIIADKPPEWKFDDVEFVKWDKKNEIKQLQQIDIGIMPLLDTEWERGKCGFKALQYMALEKPAVVSNVGVNQSIIDHGINGYLCQTNEDWIGYLSALISDEKLRKKMGKLGREKVGVHYSVQSNTKLFLSLFE